MGGGLMQLVAYGAQDVFLTGTPEITFWKVSYRRHTNFAMESIEQTFSGQADFGRRVTCTISRNGDLAYRTYLQVTVPEINQTMATNARWLDYVGEQLVAQVEVEIGGQRIDRQYGDWMHIWNQVTLTSEQQRGYFKMIGNTTQLTFITDPSFSEVDGPCDSLAPRQVCAPRNALPETTLYVPLQFWFCTNPGLALPLIALQYHEVKINVIWKEPLEIAGNYNNVSKLPQASSAALYIDYIYLDTEERRRFAQQSHEYLIEQVQFNEDVGISSPNQRIDLTFNHPVKELIWVVQPRSYTDCKAAKKETRTSITTRLLPYVYDKPAVYEQWIQMNGQDRLERRYGDYFNKVQPYQHHTGFVPGVGVYMYSFAIKPEENQPSGTCNFSRVDTATIVMTMDGSVAVNQDTDDTWNVRVYAINYNVLRIMSGMGGLAYSN